MATPGSAPAAGPAGGLAWARADRDVGATERDLDAARREVRTRQAELEGCGREREALLPTIAGSFGGDVPLDPIAEVERRIREIQALKAGAEAQADTADLARAEAAAARSRPATMRGRSRCRAAPSLCRPD